MRRNDPDSTAPKIFRLTPNFVSSSDSTASGSLAGGYHTEPRMNRKRVTGLSDSRRPTLYKFSHINESLRTADPPRRTEFLEGISSEGVRLRGFEESRASRP